MDARIRARRMEVQRAEMRRRRRISVSVAAVLLAAAAAVMVVRSPLFGITEVRVAGVAEPQAAAVKAAVAIEPGDNLLLTDLAAAARRVEALPWVREAHVMRMLPSTVQVRVGTREAALVVRLPDSNWLVDIDGVVLAEGSREGLPQINAPSSVLPPVGSSTSDAAVRTALDVHRALPAEVRALVRVYDATTARGLRLHLAEGDRPQGVWVRFGRAERIDAKVRSIHLLLEHARAQAVRIRGAPPAGLDDLGVSELDVRAPDNPVLVPAAADSSAADADQAAR